MTEKRPRKRGFLPTSQGLKILEARRQKKGYTYAALSEAAGLNSEDQVKRLFNPHWGYKVQRDAIEKIAKALDLQPTDFIEDWLPKPKTTVQQTHQISATTIDWREVCRVMLVQQQKDQQIRRKATERGFEVKVHVPLGLVERKQQQRRAEIISSESVYDLDREAIARIYEHDKFLETVIGSNSQRENQHIAIVGEPGAGKTTILDRIATYIQNQTKAVSICISLAGLQGKSLQEYILENWLPEAISLIYPDLDLEGTHHQSLQKWLRKGGVWLLLDGVDEMGRSGGSRLQEIRHQLTDWLGRVRVVLTCRSNVWDAQLNNPLTGFETYKTQDFKREDIDNFIQQWFAQAEDNRKGEVLQTQLKEPQRDRLCKLVTNPLRLSLLCQIFYKTSRAELPETKADLYQLFVRYFYEWKPTLEIDWVTQLGLQNELHQALGRLAIAGLESLHRFRLPLSLIQQEMDDRLFKLAWELGWLNLVDRDAETDEPVYAFFHPTFQEYFAALAIEDWHFFLNHVPDNPDEGTYRVFEHQWKEVILLWIGFSHLDDRLKDKFIEELLEFEDNCNLCYELRLHFLVVALISEFRNCIFCDDTLNTAIEFSFGYLNEQESMWKIYNHSLRERAKMSLKQTDCKKLIQKLNDLLIVHQSQSYFYSFLNDEIEYFIRQMSKIDMIHEKSEKNQLYTLKEKDEENKQCFENAFVISKSEPLNDRLDPLIDWDPVLQEWNTDYTRSFYSTQSLEDELEMSSSELQVFLAFSKLSQAIDKDDIDEAEIQIYELSNYFSQDIIYEFKENEVLALREAMKLFSNEEDSEIVEMILKVLGCSVPGNSLIFDALVWSIFQDTGDYGEDRDDIDSKKISALKKVMSSEQMPLLVKTARECSNQENLINSRTEIFWHCAEHMSYPDFYRAWHNLDRSDSDTVRNSATTQHLNLSELPISLRAELANDRELDRKVHLVCIDVSQFSDRDNPAADIYIDMVEQNCPQCKNGTPITLQQLKTYWRLNLRTLDKQPVLVFYSSQADCDFSETFLNSLNTFGGTIAIVSKRLAENFNSISPDRPDLIAAILKFLRRSILEA